MQSNLNRDEVKDGYRVTGRMKCIWSVEADLLQEFQEVCRKYGLTYFIWSGTLLGAVRHHGFIPWDDDVDVAMPRRDFNKLKEIAQEAFIPPYSLQTNENDTGFFAGGLCRLRNIDTTGVELRDVERVSNWGIWIDILALDYIYGDEAKRKNQIRHIGIYHRLCMLQTIGPSFWGFQKLKKWKQKVYLQIVKRVKRAELLRRFDEACIACDESEARYVGVFTGGFNQDAYQCFYKEDFESTVELDFENLKVKAPAGYDRYLGMVNGNYRNYPPKESRVPCHTGIFDAQTPYRELQFRLAETFHGAHDKTLVIFGAGAMFEDYMARYGERFRPAFIVDNGRNKWGRLLHGIMVNSPDELMSVPKEKLRVIVCNIYYREIEKQLQKMGIEDYHLYIQNRDWLNDILYPELKKGDTKKEKSVRKMELTPGCSLSGDTGMIERGNRAMAATEFFYKAEEGSRLSLSDSDYMYAVATYSPRVDPSYIYTYCYQKEENWTSYNCDFKENTFLQDEYVFQGEVYFRIVMKRSDGGDLKSEEAAVMENAVQFTAVITEYEEKEYFTREIELTAAAVKARREAADSHVLTFALLADSHYTVNGTWQDTAHNIEAVGKRAGYDAIIHLGDLTDGMVSARVTKEYSRRVIGDLKKNRAPVFVLMGNHDTNYFHGNPEALSDQEQCGLYMKPFEGFAMREKDEKWYYADYDGSRLRCIFLDSFDYREKVRYGFPDVELQWLRKTLEQTPAGYSVLVFSHVPPLAEIHVWSDTIRNGEGLVEMLEAYDTEPGRCVMAFIHGHNHADQIYTKRRFPIISIGCAKCEYFTDKKPEGAVTAYRELDSLTQDLWDVMMVNTEEKKMEFIRFGAGDDRVIVRC